MARVVSSDWNEDEKRVRVQRCNVGHGRGACGERATHFATNYVNGEWFCDDHAVSLADEGVDVEAIDP